MSEQAGAIPNAKLDMPSLFYPNRKPVGKVKIDWSHPLSRGLELFVMNIEGYPVDLVSKRPLVINGASRHISSIGDNMSYNKSVDNSLLLAGSCANFSGASNTLQTAGTLNSLDQHGSIAFGWNNNGAHFWQVADGGYYLSGGSAFGGAPAVPMDGSHYNITYAVSPADSDIYINGKFSVHDTQTAPALPTGVKDIYIGRWVGGTAFSYEGLIEYTRAWSRRLTSQEIASLHKNPYQFLIPDRG